MIRKTLLLFLFTALLHVPFAAIANGVYQTKDAFLNEAFDQSPPKPNIIWVTKDKKQVIEDILQHRAGFLRLRYWQQEQKTVWILNEIGKEKPITVGVVINNGKIQQLKVLAFRESRGWEVKHDFFTRQFNKVSLSDETRLSETIDGISGATLSVRALKKIARIALYLNQHIP